MRPFHRPFLPQGSLSAPTKGHQNTDLPALTIQPRRTCSNPPFTSTLPALNIQWHTNRQQSVVGKQTDQPKSECCRTHKKNTRTHTTQRRHGRGGQRGENCGGGLVRACCCAYRRRSTIPHLRRTLPKAAMQRGRGQGRGQLPRLVYPKTLSTCRRLKGLKVNSFYILYRLVGVIRYALAMRHRETSSRGLGGVKQHLTITCIYERLVHWVKVHRRS